MALHLPLPISRPVVLRDLGDVQIYVHGDDYVATAPLELESQSPIERMMAVVAGGGKRIVYLDVGCNYGIQLCRAARYIESLTDDHRIISFDPGTAAELVPYNLLKNGLQDDVTFIRAAVWTEDGVAHVYSSGRAGSVDEGIVPLVEAERIDWIAPCVSLRSILPPVATDAPIFAKLDTQGADQAIIESSGEFLRQMAFIYELVPWAVAKQMDVAGHLSRICASHWVFNLGYDRDRFDEVEEPGIQAFLNSVYETSPYWTDVLCVPKAFPELRAAALAG